MVLALVLVSVLPVTGNRLGCEGEGVSVWRGGNVYDSRFVVVPVQDKESGGSGSHGSRGEDNERGEGNATEDDGNSSGDSEKRRESDEGGGGMWDAAT
jgi:hypothetical protein